MIAVRMAHPQHGYTHAFNSEQVARLLAAGWEDADAPQVKPQEPRDKEDCQPKRRGRPPKG